MSATYRSSKTRDQQVADAYLGDFLPCRYCGRSTERATLTEYGARCGDCYQQYLTGGQPLPPMPTREQRAATVQRMKAAIAGMGRPSTQWAVKLQQREEAGETLSIAQREAWRTALHAHGVLDAVLDGADVPRAAVTDALLVTGDLPQLDDDEALWESRARDAERERLSTDPRFAGWASRA